MKYNKGFGFKITAFSKAFLNGVGQIMLQESAITGLLFLIGIFIGSIEMGIATILAVTVGNVTAMLFKYDKLNIESGLYGFSPALVGVAIILFYKPSLLIWIIIVIGSSLSAILQHFFIKRRLRAYTFPFVLVTWIILFVINNFHPLEPSELINLGDEIVMKEYFFAFKGIGQVIFQGDLIVGVLFFVAIFVNSPLAAIYALIGGFISGLIAMIFLMPIETIWMGLFSYNAVLSAIVFSGKGIMNVVLALTSVILSLLIAIIMYKFGLTQLTFPFVIATVITHFIGERAPNLLSVK